MALVVKLNRFKVLKCKYEKFARLDFRGKYLILGLNYFLWFEVIFLNFCLLILLQSYFLLIMLRFVLLFYFVNLFFVLYLLLYCKITCLINYF